MDIDTRRLHRLVCFSPDGRSMYYATNRFYGRDLAAGREWEINGIPQDAGFEWTLTLQCAPDNRTLFFIQTAALLPDRSSHAGRPHRLCRVATDGSDFRVLYEDPAGCLLRQIGSFPLCWAERYAILERTTQGSTCDDVELFKLDLESGAQMHVLDKPRAWLRFTFSPDLKQIVWSGWKGGINLYSLEDGSNRRLAQEGSNPSWSPSGRKIAFMKDQHRLSIVHVTEGSVQDIAWFAPPCLTSRQCGGSGYATTPVWSPEGRMLWFTLTRTRPLPAPRNLQEVFVEISCYIHPIIHNLNPHRRSHHVGYKRHGHEHREAILDLAQKQVKLGNGYHYGVDWVPEAT